MAKTLPRGDRIFEKYAWLLPFADGLFTMAVGLWIFYYRYSALCTSFCGLGPSLPSYLGKVLDDLSSEIGFFTLFVGVLATAVAWTGFKGGQRWAWYYFLAVLGFSIGYLVLYGMNTPTLVSIALAAIGLVISYRKFFPKKAPQQHSLRY